VDGAIRFDVFETALGFCAIAWSERGIVGIQLPEPSAAKSRGRLRGRFPTAREGAPPPAVLEARAGIVALLRGEHPDLSQVPLDFRGVPELHRRVYEIARTIPAGATQSYGEVAERMGDRLLARDVGQALARNPFSIVVPCHRVLGAGGKLGGFSARGGVATKQRLLDIEGAPASRRQLGLFEPGQRPPRGR
jgi:methylated-DNA-[protein]-cysteine S-methyltransferase